MRRKCLSSKRLETCLSRTIRRKENRPSQQRGDFVTWYGFQPMSTFKVLTSGPYRKHEPLSRMANDWIYCFVRKVLVRWSQLLPLFRMAASKSFIVLGGAGFLGSHIVEQLISRGEQTVAVYDAVEPADDEIIGGVKYFYGDITDEEKLVNVFKEVCFLLLMKTHNNLISAVLVDGPVSSIPHRFSKIWSTPWGISSCQWRWDSCNRFSMP